MIDALKIFFLPSNPNRKRYLLSPPPPPPPSLLLLYFWFWFLFLKIISVSIFVFFSNRFVHTANNVEDWFVLFPRGWEGFLPGILVSEWLRWWRRVMEYRWEMGEKKKKKNKKEKMDDLASESFSIEIEKKQEVEEEGGGGGGGGRATPPQTKWNPSSFTYGHRRPLFFSSPSLNSIRFPPFGSFDFIIIYIYIFFFVSVVASERILKNLWESFVFALSRKKIDIYIIIERERERNNCNYFETF